MFREAAPYNIYNSGQDFWYQVVVTYDTWKTGKLGKLFVCRVTQLLVSCCF